MKKLSAGKLLTSATINKLTFAQIQEAKKQSLGRNCDSADWIEITKFHDGTKVDYWWNDGALVTIWEE